jgi:hypothetical protein
MPFGATQQEIQFSPFKAWLKGIINNLDFYNRTYHISYFLNKLDFTRNTTKLEPHHLDLLFGRYAILNLASNLWKIIKTKQLETLNTLIRPLSWLANPVWPANTRNPPGLRGPVDRRGLLGLSHLRAWLTTGAHVTARGEQRRRGDGGSTLPVATPVRLRVPACSPRLCASRGATNWGYCGG